MASLVHARPLTEEDAEALAPIDQLYALRFGLEPALTRSSLSFYLRSGHAFVAVREGEPAGFALAQAVWNGTRPTLYLSRLAVADFDLEARLALLEAVTKSAYDAGVYDLQVQLVAGDELGRRALVEKDYKLRDYLIFERVLGSRGARH